MADTAFALSVVNIMMFLLAIVSSANTMRYVKSAHKTPPIKFTIYVFLIATIIMSIWFVIAQSLWLIEDHNSVVGDQASLMWLVYDYAKAVHTLAALAMVYIYLRWVNCTEPNSCFKRRRRTDP